MIHKHLFYLNYFLLLFFFTNNVNVWVWY